MAGPGAARTAPLSSAQERLWFVDAAAPGSPVYNVPLLVRWHGTVDLDALRTALLAVVAKHEVLRTTYQDGPDGLVQTVGEPRITVTLAEGDVDAEARRGFDLAAGPPLRCAVWRDPGGDRVLLTVHHIAIDGWSLAALFEDLDAAYAAAEAGEPPQLTGLPLQYADFSVWERENADKELLARRIGELSEVPAGLRLGGARPVPDGLHAGAQHRFALPAEVYAAVAVLARERRVTPFVVLLAAYAEVLARWSARADFLVGAVTANRTHSEVSDLIGFFVNTVPLRCTTAGATFAERCAGLRREAFGAMTNQRIPYRELAAGLPGRGNADAGFVLQNMPAPRLTRCTPPDVLATGVAKFDVLLIVDETPDGPAGTIDFDLDRYPAALGPRLAEDFVVVLRYGVGTPDAPLSALRLPHGPLAQPEPVAAGSGTGRRTAPAALPAPEPTGREALAGLESAAEPDALTGRGAPTEPDAPTGHGAPTGPETLTEHERQAAALFRDTLAETGFTGPPPGRTAHFFALGGHSLLAVTMLARAQERHGVAVRPGEFLAEPTVARLGELLAASARAAGPAAADDGGPRPATSTQQRFWFLDRMPELRAAYLVPAVFDFPADLDVEAARAALDVVLARHPALRSRFSLDRKLRQVVCTTSGAPATAVVSDGRDWDEAKAEDHFAELCWTPFDLAREAPARAELVRLRDRVRLVLCAHHAVVDGASVHVLLDEVGALVAGRELPPPAVAAPVEETADPAELIETLRGAPTDVELPHDRPRGTAQSILGTTHTATLGPKLAGTLQTVTAELGCSTFLTTAAVLAVTLARQSGQRDFLFAFPWSGRTDERAVGMFVNTLTLRADLRGNPTWREFLDRVREAGSAAYRAADVPFDAVAAALHPDRDLSRPPITPVYLAADDEEWRPPLGGVARPLEPVAVKYELELTATRTGTGDLRLSAAYPPDLFDESTITRLLAGFTAAAAALAADLDAPTCEES